MASQWVSLESPLPSASPPPCVQGLEPELPPSPPVPDVTTPEPGVYHGICEYPPLGQCRRKEDLWGSAVGRGSWRLGQGFPGQWWRRLYHAQRHQALGQVRAETSWCWAHWPRQGCSTTEEGSSWQCALPEGHTQTSDVLAAALTLEAVVGAPEL